jgi:hypothetical protein
VLVAGSLPVASALPSALAVGAAPVVGVASPELPVPLADDVGDDVEDDVLAGSDVLAAPLDVPPPAGSPQARSSTQEPMQTRPRIVAPYRARLTLGKGGPRRGAARY